VRSDLFRELGDSRYDLIVCNPPYVPARDMARLPPEFRHEPALALASGRDGLDFVRRLLAEAARHLTRTGVLVVEVGDARKVVERAFPDTAFTWLETAAGVAAVFAVAAGDIPSHQRTCRSYTGNAPHCRNGQS
jgi:ribosomal protein L3 glutamine methyltransferase